MFENAQRIEEVAAGLVTDNEVEKVGRQGGQDGVDVTDQVVVIGDGSSLVEFDTEVDRRAIGRFENRPVEMVVACMNDRWPAVWLAVVLGGDAINIEAGISFGLLFDPETSATTKIEEAHPLQSAQGFFQG